MQYIKYTFVTGIENAKFDNMTIYAFGDMVSYYTPTMIIGKSSGIPRIEVEVLILIKEYE